MFPTYYYYFVLIVILSVFCNCRLLDTVHNVINYRFHNTNLTDTIKVVVKENLALEALKDYLSKYVHFDQQLTTDELCLQLNSTDQMANETIDESNLSSLQGFELKVNPIQNQFAIINSKLETFRHNNTMIEDPADILELIRNGKRIFREFATNFFKTVNDGLKYQIQGLLQINDQKLGRSYNFNQEYYTVSHYNALLKANIPLDEVYQLHSYAQVKLFQKIVSNLRNCTKSARNVCLKVFEKLPKLELSTNVDHEVCDSYSSMLNVIDDMISFKIYERIPEKSINTLNDDQLSIIRNRVDYEQKMAAVKLLKKFLTILYT